MMPLDAALLRACTHATLALLLLLFHAFSLPMISFFAVFTLRYFSFYDVCYAARQRRAMLRYITPYFDGAAISLIHMLRCRARELPITLAMLMMPRCQAADAAMPPLLPPTYIVIDYCHCCHDAEQRHIFHMPPCCATDIATLAHTPCLRHIAFEIQRPLRCLRRFFRYAISQR